MIIDTAMTDPEFALMVDDTYHYFVCAKRQATPAETIVSMHTESVTPVMAQWNNGYGEARPISRPSVPETTLDIIKKTAQEQESLRTILVTAQVLYKWCQIASSGSLATITAFTRAYGRALKELNARIARP
ncbi:uncharacterized protein LOC129599684 [Paramacrobiotus metropolitanus]|uniref:uncharacterized protein LOC129599684 n=1 Tax=Paramacrobiotus metropolitanus TaxID=2943436 RepID=UPI002445B61A|nr:uncharacterized protein LOC129599684 [Paramacrobiotus metropolitanus]